jgi:hypothetical protein
LRAEAANGKAGQPVVRNWYTADPDEQGEPPAWLYVSKRLQLEYLPNTPLWSAPVITFGDTSIPTALYRLSARVLVWLEKAGDQLEAAWQNGLIARTEIDAYCNAMAEVWAFAGEHLRGEAVRAVRPSKIAPTLPDVAGPK